jgi:hypothetical protein
MCRVPRRSILAVGILMAERKHLERAKEKLKQ